MTRLDITGCTLVTDFAALRRSLSALEITGEPQSLFGAAADCCDGGGGEEGHEGRRVDLSGSGWLTDASVLDGLGGAAARQLQLFLFLHTTRIKKTAKMEQNRE